MKLKIADVVIIIQCLSVKGIQTRLAFLWQEDPIWNDCISTSAKLWVTETLSKVTCAFECFNDTSCETFFYRSDIRECQGHSATLDDTTGCVATPGSRYYKVRCKGGDGYQYNRQYDFCFRLYFIDDISWHDAQLHCNARHGWLIEFGTVSKALWFFNYLNSLPSTERKTFWNGMSDVTTEGTFVWSRSGLNNPYSSSQWVGLWKPGQPDDANGNQDCGIMKYLSGVASYRFDDFSCDGLNKKHICECDAV